MATVSPTPRTTSITLASPSAGPFDVGFRLFEADALKVWVDSEVNTNFTVTATFVNGYDDAAKITFGATLATSTVIVIDGNMIPARDDDYLNGPGLVSLMNIELARAWATLSELKMRLDRAALGLDPALTLEDVQGIVAAAGSVPAPTGGQTGYLMQATGAGAYGWISRATALGAALEAVRGLTPAADRLAYFNGPAGAALATFTAFARSLLDDPDATTMQATLGLVPGTNVQAQNAILSQIAGLGDPNAARLVFWDDTAGSGGAMSYLILGAGLSISGSIIAAALNPLTIWSAASGTQNDWTVPGGTTEIEVIFDRASLNATGRVLVQMMVGGLAVSTGYTGGGTSAGITNAFAQPSLTGSVVGVGKQRITRREGKSGAATWIMDNGAGGGTGSVTLAGEVTGIRVLAGAGAFNTPVGGINVAIR